GVVFHDQDAVHTNSLARNSLGRIIVQQRDHALLLLTVNRPFLRRRVRPALQAIPRRTSRRRTAPRRRGTFRRATLPTAAPPTIRCRCPLIRSTPHCAA